jgi:hypothetical protein
MIILLDDTYYDYWELDEDTYIDLMEAESMGRYFNKCIKSRGGDGPFDCRRQAFAGSPISSLANPPHCVCGTTKAYAAVFPSY